MLTGYGWIALNNEGKRSLLLWLALKEAMYSTWHKGHKGAHFAVYMVFSTGRRVELDKLCIRANDSHDNNNQSACYSACVFAGMRNRDVKLLE